MADEKQNSFKKLHAEYEDHFTIPKMEAIARNIKNMQENVRTTSGIFDLFVPKAIKTFARILGGESDATEELPPHTGQSSRHSQPKGPGER